VTGEEEKPFTDYWLGDYITLGLQDRDPGSYRVYGIGLTEYSPCVVHVTLDLNSIRLEHAIKQARIIESLTMGTAGNMSGTADTSTPMPDADPRTISESSSSVDHGGLTGLGGDDHTQYLNETRHDALPADNPHSVTLDQVGGTTDHGTLDGLADDDHAQYLLTTGARSGASGQAQDFGANGIKSNLIVNSSSNTVNIEPSGGYVVVGKAAVNNSITVEDNTIGGTYTWLDGQTLSFVYSANPTVYLDASGDCYIKNFNLGVGTNLPTARVHIVTSSGTALKIAGGIVDGGDERYTNLADATADKDALNRQTGDARYAGIAYEDHGALGGLGDDDHSQYLLATGARTGASGQAQDFGANGIKTNEIIPSSGTVIGISNVIDLDDTISSVTGIITKNGSRFFHNFHHLTGSTAVPTGRNLFIGEEAGNFSAGSTATSTSHGSFNLGIGWRSLRLLTTGYNNVGIGYASFYSLTSGIRNGAIGHSALQNLTTGSAHVAVGYRALMNITTSSNNVGVGYYAGMFVDGGANNTISFESVYLGYDTRAGSDGNHNEIVIGYAAIGSGSNTATLGSTAVVKTVLRGDVHVGGSVSKSIETITAAATLDITHYTVLCDATAAAFTVTLPAASGATGRIYNVKKIDSGANAVTVDADGAETIDGDLTAIIGIQYTNIKIQCDGSNWYIL